MKPRIGITLGDPAGIGPEIVSKALRDPRVRKVCQAVVIGDPVAFKRHRLPLPAVEMLAAPGLVPRFPIGRASAAAGRSAIDALRLGIGLVRARQIDALATAPVSKESFEMADLGFPGHTEWLAHECGVRQVAMLMVAERDGRSLRAILLTRHIALQQVSSRLTGAVIAQGARLGYAFVKKVLRHRHPRLVMCGLNPHAGDGGIIGREEKRVVAPALRRLAREGIAVAGPYSSDAIFPAMAEGRYDLALAAYHDQGMIPLKLFAGEHLVNMTLGLPFIRTSPGHGTAYDIAGKNKADPRPMAEAILLAARYSR